MHHRPHPRIRGPLVALSIAALVLAALTVPAGAAGKRHHTAAGPDARSHSTAGNTLVMYRAQDIFGFDPAVQGDSTSLATDLAVYDQLVELAPDGKSIVPGLATKWVFSNGNKVILFTLRPGVRFSDGSLVKPSNVVFSLNRATNPKGSYSSLFGGAVKSTSAVGKNQVKITLTKPYSPILASLSLWLGSIYSKANWTKWGKAASQHPIGTGPYALEKWVKGSEVDLVPNKYYWGKPKPTIQRVVIKVVGDQSARALALQSGAADIVDGLPPNQVSAITSSGAKVSRVLGASVLLVMLNHITVPAFKDKNVRLALAYSIDRAAIASAAYFGQAVEAKSAFPSSTLFYNPSNPITYDMAKAAQYLKDSGYASGFSFKLIVPAGGSPEATAAQIWSTSLSKLGISLTIDQVDQTTAYQQWGAETYQATTLPNWVNDTPDPVEFAQYTISATAPTGIAGFHTGYVNAAAAALAAQGQIAQDKSSRQRIYTAIQKVYNEDAPILYVVDTPLLYGVASRIKGFQPNPAGNGNYYLNRVTISK